MKFSNLGVVFLSAAAVQAHSKSIEPNCTHLLLANPKSGSTAAARAICNALQSQGETACIHEPIRVQHERDVLRHTDPIYYHSAPITFCKDMASHNAEAAQHAGKILAAIKASENPIVFLKSNPVDSCVSLLKLRFQELDQRFQRMGGIKQVLSSEVAINEFSKQALTEIIRWVNHDTKHYQNVKQQSEKMGKDVLEINGKSFSESPHEEMNKVMASWDKEPIDEEVTLNMSPVVYLDQFRGNATEVMSHSYQMGVADLWDSVRGDVYSPVEKMSTPEEKIKALMHKYVPVAMHGHFSKVMDGYLKQIKQHAAFEGQPLINSAKITNHEEL